jgi:5-carboxymethyl-2-hydroxymuconate isomerase
MPHLTLEYSVNILEKNNFKKLFTEFNEILASTLPTDIKGCKCRAYPVSDFVVGEDASDNAFVHIELKILRGRDGNTMRETGMKIMETARTYFTESFKKLSLQLTLEIIDLPPHYFKFASKNESIQIIPTPNG